MISVIIPVYNQASKLKETLESLVKQSYQDFEVIIVNDGSKDGPEKSFQEFVEEYNPNNSFLFLNNSNNLGAPAARNRGFEQSQGEFILFCDADAVLKPEALEEMLKALKANKKVSYVYSSFYWGRKLFKLGPFDSEKLKNEPYIHTMSLIRFQAFPKTGWDERIKKLQDWDLWLTLLENGHQGYWINKVLFTVKTGGTISSWLPAFAYRALPFLPQVKKYKQAVTIIKKKHNLI